MDAIRRSPRGTASAIVEDAAQALGADVSAGGRSAASASGCFSLYATKNITTGEGGVITTDDDGVADRLRLLRNQGMRERYQYEVAGHNYRMTNLPPRLASRSSRGRRDQRRAVSERRRAAEGLAGHRRAHARPRTSARPDPRVPPVHRAGHGWTRGRPGRVRRCADRAWASVAASTTPARLRLRLLPRPTRRSCPGVPTRRRSPARCSACRCTRT